MTYERLHHVQLAMPGGREPEAREFYADVLGHEEVEKPPVLAARAGAWFRSGGVELHLGVEDASAPARKAHPTLLVSDLDEVVARLERAGQDVRWDDGLPGCRRAPAHDPFGNRLELLEPMP